MAAKKAGKKVVGKVKQWVVGSDTAWAGKWDFSKDAMKAAEKGI
jgi:hypothetical protein